MTAHITAGFPAKDFWSLTPREWGVWMTASIAREEKSERREILRTWAGVHYDLKALQDMLAANSGPYDPQHLDQMLTNASVGMAEIDMAAFLETKRQRGE